jgi:hypothetical protein
MSAFGTVDARDQRAVQLTYPRNFARAYVEIGTPLQYAPSFLTPSDVVAGTDSMAQIHEQRRREANARVMNGVRDTRMSKARAFSSPHGYDVPAPVLSQRRFANPSYGALSIESARRDTNRAPFLMVESPLTGGVIRTAEGQEWLIDRRKDRMEQLNRISAEKEAFKSGVPITELPSTMGAPIEPSSLEKMALDFGLVRQRLADLVVVGDVGEIALQELGQFISLLVRYIPLVDREEMTEVLQSIEMNLIPNAEALVDPDYDPPSRSKFNFAAAETLNELLAKARTFVEKMLERSDLSPKEKMDRARALVRDLKFGKFISTPKRLKRREEAAEQRDIELAFGGDDDDGDERNRLNRRDLEALFNPTGDFTRTAPTREDTTAAEVMRRTGVPQTRAALDRDNRQYFGEQSGNYYGEAGAVKEAPREFIAPETLRVARAPEEIEDREEEEAEAEEDAEEGKEEVEVEGLPRMEAPRLTRAELRRDYDTLDKLAELGREYGIKVYRGSDVKNVHRNFIKKLGLA